MTRFFKDNGLTVALMLLFLGSLVGQWLTGVNFENEELVRHGEEPMSAIAFLSDPQFLSTVFENWESEFLQMATYVVLTGFLIQRGSAESKDPDQPPRDGDLTRKSRNPDAPAALRMSAPIRWLYAHSLGIALLILFIASFLLHLRYSTGLSAEESTQHGVSPPTYFEHLTSARFWFESFQNWQSEFLSTAVLVVLSIWLRHKDSPESKAVTDPHSKTGA